MTAPWFASTLSVGGGKCNDSTLPATRRRPHCGSSARVDGRTDERRAGSWFNIQFYRFVTGSFATRTPRGTAPPRTGGSTGCPGTSCTATAIPPGDGRGTGGRGVGDVIADPHSVALAWGRGASPTPSPPRPDGSIALGTGASLATTSTMRRGGAKSCRCRSRGTGASRSRGGSRTTGTPPSRHPEGTGDVSGFSVKFTAGNTDITGVVVAGTYSRSIAPGSTMTLTLRLTRCRAAIGGFKREFLTATSQDGVTLDSVVAAVVVR